MKIVLPSFSYNEPVDGAAMLQRIERAGRVCYKSEERISADSAERFVRRLLKSGHESVLEHEKITVTVICDRGVSHEIVRHRIASYSQESTRYCNYTGDRFGNELTFIQPCFWKETDPKYQLWKEQMQRCEDAYFSLIQSGAKPEEARSVLPNSLKTELVITMDLREWRHFFRLRTAPAAHPQMRELAFALLNAFQREVPVLFDDLPAGPEKNYEETRRLL